MLPENNSNLSSTPALGNRQGTASCFQSLHFLPLGSEGGLFSWTSQLLAHSCSATWDDPGCQLGHMAESTTMVVSVVAVARLAISSAPGLWAGARRDRGHFVLPHDALATVMVEVAGASVCPASDAPFLGPCSCVWGQ